MATEEINLNVNSNIKTVTKDTENLNKNLKGTAKAGKDAGKEISGGMQAASAGAGMLDSVTGGLATKFMEVGKASMKSGKAMKSAMIASGIGLVVALVATLVQHWDSIKKIMDGVTGEQEKQLTHTKELLTLAQEELDIINMQDATQKLLGKSAKEIRDAKREQVESQIALIELGDEETLGLLEQAEIIAASQLEAEKKNKRILTGLLKYMSIPLTLITGTVDRITWALSKLGVMEKATTITTDIFEWQASLLFDPEEVDKKGQEEIDAIKKNLIKLKNLRDTYKLQDIADEDAAASGGRDFAQELADFKAALAEKTASAEADTDIKRIERERDKHIAALDKLKVEDDEKTKLKLELNKLYDDRVEEIEQKRRDDKFDKDTAYIKKWNADEAARRKTQADLDKKAEEAKTAMHENTFKAVEGLAANSEEASQALAAAKTIYNTQQAIMNAMANVPAPWNVVQAAITGAMGIRALAAITSTSSDTSMGGGTAAVPPAPQMMSGAFELSGGQAVEPARAYVVSDDITNNQNKLAIIRRRATI